MIWTAFILGFAGSMHCMGMCSPLVMSITNLSTAVLLNRFLYNAGRIITYGLIGSIIASIGIVWPLVKYQNLVSIIMGIGLLVIGLAGVKGIRIPILTSILERFSLFLKGTFKDFIQRKNYGAMFVMGSLNGILPCGLSFLAFTSCLALPGPMNGFVFMIVFGLGTLPVMFGFTGAFSWLSNKFQLDGKRLATGMLILSGILLIARVFIVHLPHTESLQQGVVDIVLCR